METIYIVLWTPTDDHSQIHCSNELFHERKYADMFIELAKAKGSGLNWLIAEATILPTVDHEAALGRF